MQISPIINKVLSFITKNTLIEEKDICLLGVSGGPDSVALLDIFFQLKNILKITVGIAHVNYNLRGQASTDEENYVRELSEKYEIPFFNLSIDLNSIPEKGSLEDKARNIRYEFFEKISLENNYNKIILGHNANDQAETILMKLIRGSVSGLKGIQAKREFSINNKVSLVRPLLGLSRIEIEDYCRKQKLSPKTDFSNFENIYTRNRIRNNILPLFIAENSNFLETVEQTSIVLSEEDKYLQQIAHEAFNSAFIKKDSEKVILSSSVFKSFESFLQRRVIKIAYELLTGDTKSFSYKNLEAIRECISEGISKKVIGLPNDYFFTKDRNYLVFHQGSLDFSIENFCYEFNLSNQIFVPEKNINLKILIDPDEKIKLSKNIISFSSESLSFKITIRNYQPKEKFVPFGKTSEINLKEFLDKKKVPELERKNISLLYVDDRLIWIIGIARSNLLLENQARNRIVLSCIL
jgi:tRNA(Ile)-lysidine synthase